MQGRAYALWGLGVGAATSFIWLSLWDMAGTRFLETLGARMEDEIRVVLDAGREGDDGGVRSAMGIEPGGRPLVIERFIGEMREGGVDAWSISVSNLRQGQSVQGMSVMEVDVRLDATDQTIWTGTAGFVLQPPGSIRLDLDSMISQPRLQSFKLIGPDGRSLRMPSSSTEAGSSPDGGPASPEDDE